MTNQSRRNFLTKMAFGSLLLMADVVNAKPIKAKLAIKKSTNKILSFNNIHTGDQLKLAYFEQGKYIKDALHEINYFLRDFHDGTVHKIDPALLDQLYDLERILEVRKPFHILSGYRSPSTNAYLRRHSEGVAKHSLHMEGRAIDIRIEGINTKHIRNAAISMQRGGVGYYERSDFVHLDTGIVKSWES